MMATWLADVLRGAGLIVEEVAGWQNSGHGSLSDDGIVVVNHHTAGGPVGRAPSLATCIYGVPGVPGPLCNVVQTREPYGPDHFIVIAAGVSYNAGWGGWNGSTGNRMTIGLEVEHTGIEWYPDPARADQTRAFDAAVLKHLGYPDAAMSCQHFEWAASGGGGKIDIAQGVDPNLWRAQTTALMQGTTPSPRPEVDMGIVYKLAGANGSVYVVFFDPSTGRFVKKIVGPGQEYASLQRSAVVGEVKMHNPGNGAPVEPFQLDPGDSLAEFPDWHPPTGGGGGGAPVVYEFVGRATPQQ